MACQNSAVDRSPDSIAKKAKRQVSISTFEKWQRNYDREYQTLTWLKCNRDERCRDLVQSLWCSVCKEYEQRICSMKNYSDAWITGSQNQRTSNLLDHARSEQHKAAMSRHRAAKHEQQTSQCQAIHQLHSLYWRWENLKEEEWSGNLSWATWWPGRELRLKNFLFYKSLNLGMEST